MVLDPSEEGIQHPPNVGRDTAVAAQLAAAVALGRKAEETGIRWAIRGFTSEIQDIAGLTARRVHLLRRMDSACPMTLR